MKQCRLHEMPFCIISIFDLKVHLNLKKSLKAADTLKRASQINLYGYKVSDKFKQCWS